MKKLFCLLLIPIMIMGYSCGEKPAKEVKEKLEISSTENGVTIGEDKLSAIASLSHKEGTISFDIASSHTWSAVVDRFDGDKQWFSLSSTKDKLNISFEEFIDKGDKREAVIEIENEVRLRAKIRLIQGGSDTPIITFNIESISFPAEGGEIEVPMIVSNAEEVAISEITQTGSWLSATAIKREDTHILVVTATATSDKSERTATIEVSATNKDITNKATLSAIQLAADEPTIAFNPEGEINYPDKGGLMNIEVITNANVVEVEKPALEWIENVKIIGSKDMGWHVSIKALPNLSENERTASIKVKASIGGLNKSATLDIRQGVVNLTDMTLTYKVGPRTTVALPVYDRVNISIDWGDGTPVEKINKKVVADWRGDGLVEHTYISSGTYLVTITGEVERFNGGESSKIYNYMTDILSWGDVKLKSLAGAFRMTGITTLPEVYNKEILKNVTNCDGMFNGCQNLKEVPVSIFHALPNCTKLDNLFNNCPNLESIPAGLFDEMPLVTSCRDIFAKCTKITEIPEGLFDKMPLVTSFDSAFYGTSIKHVPENLFAKNTAVEDFGRLFLQCYELEEIPANLFKNNINVTKFNRVFAECIKLTEIPETLFVSMTKVQNFTNLFEECSGLTEINPKWFESHNEVTSFERLFKNCTGITSIPDGLFANKTTVYSFSNIFEGCTSLKTVGNSIFEGCTGATNFSEIFKNCGNIETIGTNLFKGCSACSKFELTFLSLEKLKSLGKGTFDGCANVKSYNDIFAMCYSLTEIDGELFKDSPLVTSFAGVFIDCKNIKNISGDIFAVAPEVTNMSYAFSGCTSLEKIPTNIFDNNRKITNFDRVFYGCRSLTGKTPYTTIGEENVKIWRRDTPDFAVPKSFTQAFTGCNGLEDWNDIYDTWKY